MSAYRARTVKRRRIINIVVVLSPRKLMGVCNFEEGARGVMQFYF